MSNKIKECRQIFFGSLLGAVALSFINWAVIDCSSLFIIVMNAIIIFISIGLIGIEKLNLLFSSACFYAGFLSSGIIISMSKDISLIGSLLTTSKFNINDEVIFTSITGLLFSLLLTTFINKIYQLNKQK